MPNIETHGFRERIAKLISERLQEEGLDKDAIITIYHDVTYSIETGDEAPYIRLVSTPGKHMDDVKAVLLDLDFDLEVVELKEFHEGKKGT